MAPRLAGESHAHLLPDPHSSPALRRAARSVGGSAGPVREKKGRTVTRLAEVLRRRERLLADSASHRSRILSHAAVLARPLSWLDRLASGARGAWARPGLAAAVLAAGVGLLAALGPGRCLSWGAKGWGFWRLWRQLRRS